MRWVKYDQYTCMNIVYLLTQSEHYFLSTRKHKKVRVPERFESLVERIAYRQWKIRSQS